LHAAVVEDSIRFQAIVLDFPRTLHDAVSRIPFLLHAAVVEDSVRFQAIVLEFPMSFEDEEERDCVCSFLQPIVDVSKKRKKKTLHDDDDVVVLVGMVLMTPTINMKQY
jgi:hypothetical protein